MPPKIVRTIRGIKSARRFICGIDIYTNEPCVLRNEPLGEHSQ